ncbi:MAG: aldehyde dehydrogenase family protein [Candidatus Marinimicrobia bacterium]|nr:aldehyde dehydrogenase family protein [Candidatus Neomarinimicrobiota bacterium]
MKYDFLEKLGIQEINYGATTGSSSGWIKTAGKELISYSPINGEVIAKVIQAEKKDYEEIIKKSSEAFKKWRMMPAPLRGQIVREIADALREYKEPLGQLVTLEMGKIRAEGLGEVQEMIDIADFAVGQSRMLYGFTMHSERPEHRMFDQYHPYGIVGVITAFNFPVAVWAWNSLLAAVCGDTTLWKPSSKTPLCAVAVQNIIAPIVDKHDLDGIFCMVIGKGSEIGDAMLNDKNIPLISATGSTRMGKQVGEAVGKRLGRTILELGGNNAIIVAEDANLEMAVRTALFGAVGTAGQRCTSTRRIIIQKSVKEEFLNKLIASYKQIPIGNPLNDAVLMGPVVDQTAIDDMLYAIEDAKKSGGKLLVGGEILKLEGLEKGYYVTPAIMEVKNHYPIVQNETFAPLLYIIEYDDFEEALALHNDVPQGLSSSLFTNSVKKEQLFLSHRGSDCGIANINIGTSGAEIGGAFGGEKETGGGRESGSDSWKAYMRRQTNTINWSEKLPLAQGIKFDL